MNERDATEEQSRTVQAAEDRMQWLASFPEQNPNPIIELDWKSGVVHYANPAARRLYDNLESQGLRHPLMAGLREAVRPLLDGGARSVQREIAVGAEFFLETITYIAESGHVRLYYTNTTERKRAEIALGESQALYLSLVQHMPAGVFRKDAAGRFIFVNSAFCESIGARAEDYLGKTASEWARGLTQPGATMLTGEIIAKLAAAADQHHAFIMQTGQRIELVEERTYADGRKQYLHVVKAPVFNSEAKIVGTQGILFDITDRRLAEEKIHEMNAQLEERVAQRTAELELANKELDAFTYSVSHDLRAPLRAINGFSEMVVEDYGPSLPEKGQHFLRVIREDALRMGMLIDDLLAFSKLGREPLRPQLVEVEKLVRRTLEELSAQVEGRELDMRIGPLPPCQGDPALLKQVWINLLSNALKYSRGRQPAVVEVGCTCEAGEQVYFVRDNGAGFDMQYADKLFGVFQRLHHSDEFEGTGVGLAIVQRIIHRHGGRVWARGEVNQGATFYFALKSEGATES